MKYKTLFVTVDRANYGRMFPVIKHFSEDDRFYVFNCFTGTTVLEKFGAIANYVHEDGVNVDYKLWSEFTGSTNNTMVATIANTTQQASLLLQETKPDIVFIIGDRYEALGFAIAVVYNNIQLAHIQGGELSGTIDEVTRHAITKLAHIHFPSTKKASEIIIQMGEDPRRVFYVGCPVSDYLLNIPLTADTLFNSSLEFEHHLRNGFILSCIHPVTTDHEEALGLLRVLNALYRKQDLPVLWILPNIDPGSNEIEDFIHSTKRPSDLVLQHLMPSQYFRLLSRACVAIGNSSSYIRDSGFFGTPVICLGTRQKNRECAENVTYLEIPSLDSLEKVFYMQLSHGKYPISTLYGAGGVAKNIADQTYEYLKSSPQPQKYFYCNE
jgi:UDP-hydrolysing UDP-N-acetyl-D-glucosamine 2-epimerase